MGTIDEGNEPNTLEGLTTSTTSDRKGRLVKNAADAKRYLDKKVPLTRPGSRRPDRAAKVPKCEPFDVRIGPSAVMPFRRAIEILEFIVTLGDNSGEGRAPLTLACVEVARPDGIKVSLALDLLFEQVWAYQTTMIADLQSTLSLVPGEEVRLEIRSTQRKVLEQTVVDSVEEMLSSESTIADKDIVNVTRSSSRSQNWHVDGNGSFSLGKMGSIGVSGGTSASINRSATSSVQQIHESTKRSAQNLKTLHKVEVRGISESLIEEKVLRVIKNPYHDRTLTLNIFQLLKQYEVTTALLDVRPALVIDVRRLVMDRTFVLANGGFLADHLLDRDLAQEMANATAIARQPLGRQNQAEAKRIAMEALRYLYVVPNIFNLPPVTARVPPGIEFPFNSNDPALSLDGSQGLSEAFDQSGFRDAVTNGAGIIFTTLGFFYRRYRDLPPEQLEDEAVSMALTLTAELKDRWALIEKEAEKEILDLLDNTHLTEILRRLSGFIAMVNGMLQPLVEPAEHEQESERTAERGEFIIQRLVDHLQCHREYYRQRFLRYLATQTELVAINQFVQEVIDRLLIDTDVRGIIEEAFDPSKAFLDRTEIVVPSAISIDLNEILGGVINVPIEVPSAETEIEVPLDGFHIEIAPGACRLPDVPVETFKARIGDLSIKDALLSLSDVSERETPDKNKP